MMFKKHVEKALKKLSSIPHDKALHMLYGVVIFAILVVLMTPLLAFVVSALIAILKEVYDYNNKENHSPDYWDAVATIVGSAFALFCTFF